ncbi:N-terminal domain of NEFA-interacting nuclear protein NIP30-domain-containing protein [Apiospora phragmitis]|uniref:N-terminal domain of NEFA-interacting nuclear protein NIP30-domain-containing protein n=1 Tax=Apiospora phragmitis TaxID=2905665 RepID=A0ABR1VJH1_9PEZI
MSSRFVSGGTLPGDTTAAAEKTSTTPAAAVAANSQPVAPSTSSSSSTTAVTNAKPSTSNSSSSSNNTTSNSKNAAEWARVQAELDAARAQREATRRANTEGGGEEKSLFDVLQANKAAKQAAFEEASRLRNQFRALDDDEVDFLDEVQEKERQEEARKRRELEEGLGKFRQAQQNKTGNPDEAEKQVEEEVVVTEDLASEWVGATAGGAGRKRKREKEVLFKGLKRKSTSEGAQEKGATNNKNADANGATKTPLASSSSTSPAPKAEQATKPPAAAKQAAPKPAMGLVAYGSDDDDDDD